MDDQARLESVWGSEGFPWVRIPPCPPSTEWGIRIEGTKYLAALSRIPAVGAVRVRLPQGAFGDLKEAWAAMLATPAAAGLTGVLSLP